VAYYSWILAFHVVSVLSWMAMLFYLPRLFVYHREHNDKDDFVEVVQIQEYKLYKYIGAPAMWATVISGS
jgi:putative membrane protein